MRYCGCIVAMFASLLSFYPLGASAADLSTIALPDLSKQLKIGDVVFVRIPVLPFEKVAEDTGSWTNHVGIVTSFEKDEWQVSESTVPLSRRTPLSTFVKRSDAGRVAVKRLHTPLTKAQEATLQAAAKARYGKLYNPWFGLYSRGQFCSRFVYEILLETLDIRVGKIETLGSLLKQNPHADLLFWRVWYLGVIPWNRETVTPASMLGSELLQPMFDGRVVD